MTRQSSHSNLLGAVACRLYAILDDGQIKVRGLSFEEVAEGLLAASPSLLQYRAKQVSREEARACLALIMELRAELSPSTEIYMNDWPDLASEVGADGVHVGQMDLSVSEVRARYPTLRVGLSTHSVADVERALAASAIPDYLAIGPLAQTGSKENPDPIVSPGELTKVSALVRARGIPLVGIGGLNAERGRAVSELVDFVAVIGALLEGTTGVETRARVLDNARTIEAAIAGDRSVRG
ncbi:MAG: hypothetical protein B6A08_02075 [Sorangiineae bacterium NIC37A_2]|nr:MAG: hypothetical protein B6A08_02075 [Sorangiineae bacterium NIC37A_2]